MAAQRARLADFCRGGGGVLDWLNMAVGRRYQAKHQAQWFVSMVSFSVDRIALDVNLLIATGDHKQF